MSSQLIESHDRVVIKFGGGLISDKANLCTARLAEIAALAGAVATLRERGIDVIVVHGAGSYGHLRCKRWRIGEGLLQDARFERDAACSTQCDAVAQVRADLADLNRHVCAALSAVGCAPVPFPPHEWAHETGVDFIGDLDRFERSLAAGEVPVTWGDVVGVDGARQFGILSGDDIVVRLALEIPRMRRLIFAVGGVDGLLAVPPNRATEHDLIARWTVTGRASDFDAFEGSHDDAIDVTGGIGLKAARGAHVALASRGAVRVVLVNGALPERVVAACAGEPVRGTEIIIAPHAKLQPQRTRGGGRGGVAPLAAAAAAGVAALAIGAAVALPAKVAVESQSSRRPAATSSAPLRWLRCACIGGAAAAAAVATVAAYLSWRQRERGAAVRRATTLARDGVVVVRGLDARAKRRAWDAGYYAKLREKWSAVCPSLTLGERSSWPIVAGGFAQSYRYCFPPARTDRDDELELTLRLCTDNPALQATILAFLDPELIGTFRFGASKAGVQRTHWRVRLLSGGPGLRGAARGALWATGAVEGPSWWLGAERTIALHGADNSWGLVLWPDASQRIGEAIPHGAHIDGAWCYSEGVPLGPPAELTVEERLLLTHAKQLAFQLAIITPSTSGCGAREGMTSVWLGSHTLAGEIVRRAAVRGERVDWVALRRSMRGMVDQRSSSVGGGGGGGGRVGAAAEWPALLHQPSLASNEVALFAGFALHTTTFASHPMRVDGIDVPRVAMNPAFHLDDVSDAVRTARCFARLLPSNAPARVAWRCDPPNGEGLEPPGGECAASARWSRADVDELERRIAEYSEQQ